MKISKISLYGFTTYREPQEIDLAALGPGIIAIAGPNGSGKTTLIEAVPGAIYRHSPSYGSIAGLAIARDAYIELAGENGKPFAIRLDCDNRNGKQEAVIFRDDTQEPLAGPKVRDFDAAIAKEFPPLEVYLASMFASQTGVGSVLRMSQSDRRKLFGRLLGLERLELLAEQARARGRATESEMTASRAALEAIRQGAGDVKALGRECAEAKDRAEAAERNEKEAEARLEAAKAELARLMGLAEAAEKAAALVTEAKQRRAQAGLTLHRLEMEAAQFEPVLSKTSEIRAAAEELRKAESELQARASEQGSIEERWMQAAELAAKALDRFDAAEARVDEIRDSLMGLDSILSRAPEIRAAAGELRAKSAKLEEIRETGEAAAEAQRDAASALASARRDHDAAFRSHEKADWALAESAKEADAAEGRLEQAEKSTASVPCAGALDDEARGACPALVGHFRIRDQAKRTLAAISAGHDDLLVTFKRTGDGLTAAAKRLDGAEAQEKAARDKAAALRAEYSDLRKEVDLLRAGDQSAALERAEAQAVALKRSLKDAERALGETGQDEQRLAREAKALADRLAEMEAGLRVLRAREAQLKAADRLPELEAAERAAAELRGRIEAARAALAEEDARLTAAEQAAEAAPTVAAEEIDSARADIVNEVGEVEILGLEAENAREDAVVLSTRLKAAREAQAKAEALAAKLAPLEADLAEWRWLGRGLGREGVQALELDAAGPRVSTLANELLADSYGSRFQVRLETMAAKADGKGTKEIFDVRVIDTERGREGSGAEISGGEQIVIGEALGLAIGLFHAESAGVELGTVIRDETTGALDPENGERYIAMLKSFLRVGHVRQLLYVCHSLDLIDLADAVVRVTDGRISVG